MSSGPITSWQIEGKKCKQWEALFFWAPKSLHMVTSYEIKRCLLLGRKAVTNLDSILKSRDIILPTKVHLVKAMVFPVVMYKCESWTAEKVEHQRIDAFKLWCWRRLEIPSDCKEIKPVSPQGNQPWIFIRTDTEAETPILLATWCEQPTHCKRPWCWEGLRAWGGGGNREWDGWIA